MLTRRNFIGTLSAAGIGALTIPLVECNSTDVWHEIEQWVPVGIQAFQSILALVAPLAAPGIDAIAQLVEAGFASLSAAIDAYLNAPAADKATLSQKIILIFNDITNNIQSFLTAIGQSSNPIVKIAVALIQIIVSTIEGFLKQIMPAPPVPVSFKVGRDTVTVVPVVRSRKDFIAAFNEECIASGHPEAKLPQMK
jgi:hypothetical protein